MKKVAVNRNGADITFELLEYEFEALLAALRRDMRNERNHQERGEHEHNARIDIRLLELLQPKSNELPTSILVLTIMQKENVLSVDAV